MSAETSPDPRSEYGIYTVGDENFFPGIVASANALRSYGYAGPIAVIDIGFLPWMAAYLEAYPGIEVLPIEPVRRNLGFTDLHTDENPAMTGWAYKAFGIVHYDRFRAWTFLDADYFALSNVELMLRPLVEAGRFVSTEDGTNHWDSRHQEAIGVDPGAYMNINAGFISLDMEVHGPIIHEWRNLMTRRRPFDLWYGDQGALNAILDKHSVPKHTLDKVLWNQTWLNESMARENLCEMRWEEGKPLLWYPPKEDRIYGWHGMGWHKLWHQIGIDHYRKGDADERGRFYKESQGKSPRAIVEAFEHFLFLGEFNAVLKRQGHLLLEP